MQYAAQTNKGLVRDRNEDNFVVLLEEEKPGIFVIADGLGGHSNGELASRIACAYASEYLEKELPHKNEPAEIRNILIATVQKTNIHVYMKSLENEENNRMGTTLTIGVLYPESFYFAHIGDTRVYRLRDNEFEQITQDHTYVGEMVASGNLSEDEVRVHPRRHVLTQAIGFPEFLDVDYVHLDRAHGDRFLMSSDGLHGVLEDDVISASLANSLSPEEVCSQMIEKSLEAGAPDNITVITIFV
ncbi:MAG: Stp1/IreP family PP2C-type Ser/Thr phosphatase [Clostridiaceae bacterium]|jgi:protein phosphatase|nr:Stp1/IreP family PP2C-type Ser/Thr phosphatase [Clostridiaceae bacterium]